ncbi:hypothetical protein HF086_003510 [Spodoptera exigua]|uniref:Uncharacterized protein n=1 Tax=Spodoptera exigua TaxID=7107 RepID=A0A922S8L0_SPOEX|nr:hypothetical protein HF086_003510 [Spodoptera exigua]
MHLPAEDQTSNSLSDRRRGWYSSSHRYHCGYILRNIWSTSYQRLIGPFAVIIFYLISVSKHTASGPGWYLGVEEETNVCAESWPKSLLMINTDIKYICHAVTWYVPCDYQLAILGTLLFYFYQKNRRLGFAIFAVVAVFSMVIPGVLTYWFRLPVVHFLDVG